jgi:hypothetical protein
MGKLFPIQKQEILVGGGTLVYKSFFATFDYEKKVFDYIPVEWGIGIGF